MLKKFIIILFFPATIFAQTAFTNDTTFEKTVEKDCGRKFTKTEVLPSLKISKGAFEDSLVSYLRSKNAVIKNGLVPFRFLLTSHSQILDIKPGIADPSPDQLILRDAILYFSDLWIPAVQNSHVVCSYVTLTVQYSDNKISAAILQ